MDNKQQQEFISWLSDKLQAQDQNDLQKKLKTLGDDGIRKAYDQFTAEKSDANSDQDSVQSNKLGGKLQYIRCLQAFAKGGALEMAECGCGGKLADGGKVNTGKLAIKKDQGSVKDSNKADKNPGKKQYIGHKADAGEKNDKPKDMKKSGEMMSGGKMKKHQVGGTMTYINGTPKASDIMVAKSDGSVGQWGNSIATPPVKTYMLAPSQNGVNQISQEQLDHLQRTVPNFNRVNQVIQKPGEVSRFGPEQSDMIRKLLNQYPMTKPTLSASLARGGRIEEDKATDQASGIKDPKAPEKKGLKGKRKDVTSKEVNPGAKQYMDLGKTKEVHTAVTKLVKKQGGGSMAGTMGGMMGAAGVKSASPQLVKKKAKLPKGAMSPA